ncbi:MAG TPA: multicopper oxidase family protein, partial [Ktedonobacteraceae bacterium]
MWALYFYTLLSLFAAAAINFSVAPDRFMEYIPFGIFFVLVAVAQVIVASLTLFRPYRRLIGFYFGGNALVLILWFVSLKVGLPVGPFAGRPEVLNVADTLIIALEVLSLLLSGLLLLRFPAARPKKPRLMLLKTIPGTLLIAIVVFIGTQTGLHGLPFAVNMGAGGMPGMNMSFSEIPMSSLVEKPGNEPIKRFTLVAKETRIHGQTFWTYNGQIPGPELRVNQGDRVIITLINDLPVGTSIHWHGLRLPNAEDGVAGITQNAVPAGSSYTYNFVVKDPGTYWYHSHQETFRQVPLGLYGDLIVEPKNANSNTYAHDYALIEGDANESSRQSTSHFAARPGELIRLRLTSAFQEDMTGTPEQLVLSGAPYQVVALDGHDINGPQTLGPELLPIGTGQRYDLVFRMPRSGQVALFDLRPKTGSKFTLQTWATLGEGAQPSVPDKSHLPTFDLASYGVPTTDTVADRASYDVTTDLTITNQVGFRDGMYQFLHMFNGKTSPYTDPIIVKEGQYVKLRFINHTNEYHPIHLHGHVFSVLSKNGKRITGSPIHLDSILVGPGETWEGAFLADNPGLWMIHCHVLVHAFNGLSTMVDYEGVTTPYVIGTKDGNFP